MRRAKLMVSWFLAVIMIWGGALGEGELFSADEEGTLSAEEIEAMVREAREEYLSDPTIAEIFESEMEMDLELLPEGDGGEQYFEVYTLTYQGNSMRFLKDVIGEPDEAGQYPLYITLHGGGEGPAEQNDNQWTGMYNYYRESVENGIYVACRGITDTGDLHFQEASYPLYDRLIAHMIYEEHADPNRVYLLGFSAGGDGVYQIAPRMADRFAAVNMSSGHPNGVSLMNLANTPISLQVGIRDFYSESAMRSVRAAEFERAFREYREASGFGYDHAIWVHVPEGHNFTDYCDTEALVLADPEEFADRAVSENYLDSFLEIFRNTEGNDDVGSMSYYPPTMDDEFSEQLTTFVSEELEIAHTNTNAVRFVDQYTRNPAPDELVWDLSTRAPSREISSFYWLEADDSVNQGKIYASFDRETNAYTIIPSDDVNGNFMILISPKLADLTRPVVFQTPKGNCEKKIEPSGDLMIQIMQETGDPEMAYAAMVSYAELGGE